MTDIIKAHIKNCLEMDRDNNLKDIKRNIEDNIYGGQYIFDTTGKYYYIVGACSTVEDYYYVAINTDREIYFLSCINNFKVVDTLPPGMSMLDYLMKLDPQEIADDVKTYINSIEHSVLFTKVNINGILY